MVDSGSRGCPEQKSAGCHFGIDIGIGIYFCSYDFEINF